jgi:hypothetical protein
MLRITTKIVQSQILVLSDCIWCSIVPLDVNIFSVSSCHILTAEMLHFTDTNSDSWCGGADSLYTIQ